MAALGAEEIRLIAEACRREANGRLILADMNKEIRKKAGKTIRTEVRAAALAQYPASGGLNEWIARASIRLAILRGTDTAGVRVRVGRKGHDFKALDDTGVVRHPVWGNRSVWRTTSVKPGVISNAISDEGKRVVEKAVLDAAERAAQRIVHGI